MAVGALGSNSSSPFSSWVARNANKARSGVWQLIGKTLDAIDTKVAQPALNARNEVVGTVSQTIKLGTDVVKNYKMILIVAGLLALVWLTLPFYTSRRS